MMNRVAPFLVLLLLVTSTTGALAQSVRARNPKPDPSQTEGRGNPKPGVQSAGAQNAGAAADVLNPEAVDVTVSVLRAILQNKNAANEFDALREVVNELISSNVTPSPEEADASTPSPPPPFTHPDDEFGSDDLLTAPALNITVVGEQAWYCDSMGGILNTYNSACCPKSCMGCGGSKCQHFRGGEDKCCAGGVATSNRDCFVDGAPPCLVPDDMTDAPTPTYSSSTVEWAIQPNTETEEVWISSTRCFGMGGYFASWGGVDVCCPQSCGGCGSRDCHLLPGGYDHCCVGGVGRSEVSCNISGPPCTFNGVTSETSLPTTPSK